MFLPADTYSIKPLWWFWLPLGLAVGLALVNPLLTVYGQHLLYAENGILEDAQVLVAFGAVILGLTMLRYGRGNLLLLAWIACAVLGSFYIGMEEISWGQQLFHWQSPQLFDMLNDQHETNLHNMSSWLDQKPKTLLRLGIIAGGVIIPLLRRYRPNRLSQRFALFYPEDAFFWPAVLSVVTDFMSKQKGFINIYDRASEVCELYIYYFILLYLAMLRLRIARPAGGAALRPAAR